MAYLVESLPEASTDAAIALHVRAHCRAMIRGRGVEADQSKLLDAVQLMFGLSPELARRLDLAALSGTADQIPRIADAIAGLTGKQAVELGHDEQFVAGCLAWLRDRVASEPAYHHVFADDRQTLLVLSEAMDLANATGRDGRPPATLILGETGTGKELLARAMHAMSVRAGLTVDTFVPVHVGGLTADFLNDELFGHEKGAFTGADGIRVGRIEEADGGTLLIDEVGDLSAEAQLRLLRVLEDGLLSRTGSKAAKAIKVKVRVLAATNRDLDQRVRDGLFRLDLLHRLRRGWLVLPALREREEWQWQVVDRMVSRHVKGTAGICRSARDALAIHSWPGNLRELDAAVERASASAAGDAIRVDHLPRHLQAGYLESPLAVRAAGLLCDDLDDRDPNGELLDARIERLRGQVIESTSAQAEDVHRIQELVELHASIPDRSPAHAGTLDRLRAISKVMMKQATLKARLGTWEAILGHVLPTPIMTRVEREIATIKEERRVLREQIDADAAAIDLGNDPWWKFIRELNGLPMFDAASKLQVQTFVVSAAKFLYTIAPEFADAMFDAIRTGGVAALRSAFHEAMKNEPAPEAAVVPEKLSATEWRALRAQFPTRRAAAEHLHCDTKTLTKYAELSLKKDPWKRERSPKKTPRKRR